MDTIIQHTKNWIEKVVIANNFCPFASKVFLNDSILYRVSLEKDSFKCLSDLMQLVNQMDNDTSISTALLILPNGFKTFNSYLHLLSLSEAILIDNKYEGIYQIASFHPNYSFAGTTNQDPANYTNRSPYPMLHLLREDQIEKALENFDNPEDIPKKNMAFARERGIEYMQRILKECFE